MLIWKFHLHSGKLTPSQIDNETLLKFSKQLVKLGLAFLYPQDNMDTMRPLKYQWLMSTAVRYRVTVVGLLFVSGLEDSGHYLV